MLTPLLAGAASALSLAYSIHVFRRCARLGREGELEHDELERRLSEKALALELGLGRRSLRALARATLFAGTGLAVWELTGGSARYLQAGGCFLLGFVGWAAVGEVERRFGSLQAARRSPGSLESSVVGPASARGRKPTR